MIGWHISVYRQTDGGRTPATATTDPGVRLCVWQTGFGGLDWLEELVKADHAIDLGGNGYPLRFTATAAQLVPRLLDGPPKARPVWTCEATDILTEKWSGKTVVDRDVAAECRDDEWLLVEAWDES
jgi:hypothetical protein